MTALNITTNCITNIARARFVRVVCLCYTIYIALCYVQDITVSCTFVFMYHVCISQGAGASVVFAQLSDIESAVKLALDLRSVLLQLERAKHNRASEPTPSGGQASEPLPTPDVYVVNGSNTILSFVRPASER